MLEIRINNEPDYAKNYEYIVARISNGEFWFWGAYETKNRAEEVSHTVNGIIIHRLNMKKGE